MTIRSLCFCVLGFAAPLAQASIEVESISCSSSLSLNDQNGISFDCGGDLSLSGGTVSAETGDLLINAAGTLSLADIWLKASGIILSGYGIFFAGSVNIEIIDVSDSGGSPESDSSVIVNSGADGETGTMELPSVVFLSSGRNINLGSGFDASRGDRPTLIGAGIGTVSEGGLNQYRGEIKLGEGGITGLNIQVSNPIYPQGVPVTIPIPAALYQWLLGLCALITPTLNLKKSVGREETRSYP